MSDFDGVASSDAIQQKLESKYDGPTEFAVASPTEVRRHLDVSMEKAENLLSNARDVATPVGFQSGSEVENPPDLTEAEVVEDIEGWNLRSHTPDRISWITDSGYSVVIVAVPTQGGNQPRRYEVKGILPPEGEHNPQKSKKQERALNAEIETVEEAVGFAVGWMEAHPVEFEEDLTEFTGVSERTAEYLLLEYSVSNHQALYELWRDSTLLDIVGKQWHDDLDSEMAEVFEG